MPRYEKHLRMAAKVAIVTAAVSIVGVYSLTGRPLLSVTVAVLTAISTLIGGQAPDIDQHSSIPRRRLNRLVQAGFVIGVSATAYFWHTQLVEWLDAAGIAVASAYVLGLSVGITVTVGSVIIPRIIQRLMPPHRGPVHSIPFWLITVFLTGLVLYLLLIDVGVPEPLTLWILASLGSGLLLGVSVHIHLDDELISFIKNRNK